MFSLSVSAQSLKKKKKKKTKRRKSAEEWKSSAMPARGTVTYPAAWVLYHQECICYLLSTDTGKKGPPDCSCIFKLHLTCSEGAWTSKSFRSALRWTPKLILGIVGSDRPGGWGVKTGKRDNGYTSGGLWALQWPRCLLTLPSASHKSHPERFIRLTRQAFSVVSGGRSCSADMAINSASVWGSAGVLAPAIVSTVRQCAN